MRNRSLSVIIKELIMPALLETIYMMIVSTIISGILAFIIALVLVLTDENGLNPNRIVNNVLNTLINVIRSFPFIILLISILPLTRLIVGTSIGANAAIVPICVSSTAFMARLFENTFKNINPALIEAAKSFGATDYQILIKVIVKESVPSLLSDMTLAIISILNATAMAGTVGAGGLGAVALTYGYQNFDAVTMYTTVFVLIVLVQLIQQGGKITYRKTY